jgi:ankyrin repeat protein
MSQIRANMDFDYELAIRQNNARRLKTLQQKGLPPCQNSVIYALKQRHAALLPILFAAGADPNEINPNGQTPLGFAVQHANEDTVRLLLEAGADPNQDSLLRKPLTIAATWGKQKVVRLLLAHGANPNGRDDSGLTALQEAHEYDHGEIIECLKEAGATARLKPSRRKSR